MKLKGAEGRTLRGYAPLVGLAALFLVMVLLAPTVAPERLVTGGGSSIGQGSPAGARSSGAAGPRGSGIGTDTVASDQASTPASSNSHIGVGCVGLQVPGDPYSPPCATWGGGTNGGATAPGVTATAVNLTLRDAGLPDPGSLIAEFSGRRGYESSEADLVRTFQVLTTWFNAHFQFYGRKLRIVPFKGQGNEIDEVLGGGQSGATADAVDASQQQHAFANLLTLTQPYADALAADNVIALDNFFLSQPVAAQRSPYEWNTFADCTKAASTTADLVVKELAGMPAAFGGTSLNRKPRKFGIITPDNAAYQPCAHRLEAMLSAARVAFETKSYALDLSSIQSSAQQIDAELQNDGVTSVILATDPATPFFFASSAGPANWYPEWILTGAAALDRDDLAQILPAGEWSHAFGISFAGPEVPPRATAAYADYAQMSPNTQPDMLLLPLIFWEMRLIAIGVQLAGPDLTPASFAAGLRTYHSDLGTDGIWAFPAGDFSAPQSAKLVWYDPHTTSPVNQQPGGYLDDGRRYPLGGFPRGNPPVFKGAP